MSRLRATSAFIFTTFALAMVVGGPAWAATGAAPTAAAPGAAPTATVKADAPASAAIGETIDVNAHVESDNKPVEGGKVTLTYSTVFIGVSGSVELDSAVTDADGNALLSYQQRAESNNKMQVAYLDPAGTSLASSDLSIAVQPGGEQLYTSSGGLSIPRLNASAIVGLIAIVWSLIIFSAFQLVSIGRKTTLKKTTHQGGAVRTASEAGSAWIGTVLAVATIVIAVGLVTVLLRNPHTHTNLGDHEGYTRTPIASVGSTYPFMWSGMSAGVETGDAVTDGRRLFYGSGCASCHGLGGEGGVVGPNLIGEVGSVDDLIGDVRRGPVGMPEFTPEVLSDAQVEKIFKFIDAHPAVHPTTTTGG